MKTFTQISRENLEMVYNNQYISDQYTAGYFGNSKDLAYTFKSKERIKKFKMNLRFIFLSDTEISNDLTKNCINKLINNIIEFISEKLKDR